jgi:uncharacterized protein
MEADTGFVGPGQDKKEFSSDEKLMAFGVKGQNMRLFDVFLLGPLMVLGGLKARKEAPVIGTLLSLFGLTTIYYNGRNYLKVKDAALFHEFAPSLFRRSSLSFQRTSSPFREGNGPKLNLVSPKYAHLNRVGLGNRSSLPSQLGFLFGPKGGLQACPRRPLTESFTMANTRIPLDIAFLNKCGRVLEIRRMPPPGSLAMITPPAKTTYAVEANAGWFEINKVKVGDLATGTGLSLCSGDQYNIRSGRCG